MRQVIALLFVMSLTTPACSSTGTAVSSTSLPTLTLVPNRIQTTAEGREAQVTVSAQVPTLSAHPALPTFTATPPVPTATLAAARGIATGPLTIEGLHAIRLVGDPQSGDSFFATTPAGLYITRDGGLTWTQVTPAPLQDEFVFSVTEPGILYAGAGADCYRDGPDEPLFKSVNGGATWRELSEVNLRPVAVHPTDPNQVWAIGCTGPAYSSDGGDTWTIRSDDLFLTHEVSQIVPARDDWSLVYASAVSEGGSGVIASTQNGGDRWTPLLRESAERPLWWINDLLVLRSAPQHIFLIDPHGLWRSPDGGARWDFFDTGLDDVIYQDGVDFSNIGLHALAVDSDTTPWTIYLGTQQGVYQSLDAGETWERLTGIPWEHASIQGLAFSRASDKIEAQRQTPRLFVTTEDGVHVVNPQGNR